MEKLFYNLILLPDFLKKNAGELMEGRVFSLIKISTGNLNQKSYLLGKLCKYSH